VTQQLRALAHPLRLRLIESFAEGPRTTMQVASRLGEPPTRLYHHVNALERAGILKLVETRAVRGASEKYYELARKQIGAIKRENLTRSSRASMGSIATAVFDEARRELLAAMARPGALTPARAPMALRMILSLPPSQLPRARKRILAMLKQIRADCARAGRKKSAESIQWALTLGFAPTVPRAK
jgi:DNA-binding transcriptional ArsR family regulator